MTDDMYQWENPGPNARWCPVCNAWKVAGIGQRHGDMASTATYTSHCATCGAQLEERAI
jgi:hypothetical protein